MSICRLLLLLGIMWLQTAMVVVVALQMEITPGETKCIGQELDQFENVVFAVSASLPATTSKKSLPPKQKLSLVVTDPEDDTIFEENISIGAKLKEFDYTINKRGVYDLCFELTGGKVPVRIFFHVDYKPMAADGKALSRKVGKDDITGLERKLEQMSERLKEISKEIEHARKQEIAMKQSSESTSSSVQWFSILSIIILVSTSVWQIIYLRSFFTAKKLL